MRLLLAEDDRLLGASLKKALEKNAYSVDWMQDGRSAAEALETLEFTAAILDVNLPHMSGLDIIREVRVKKNTLPIILLTALDAPQQKIDGLDRGADDYIVKPFDLNELLARLRALIRRSQGRTDPVLKCGKVEIDIAGATVTKSGKFIAMTAKEFRVLKFLMERAGQYCDKGKIEYALYDAENSGESNIIEVAIYSLRKKLGSDFIHSMRGVGYMVAK